MEEAEKEEKNFLINKIVGGLLFAVFGIMGFFFSLWKQNWNSAGWCLLTVFACVVLLAFNKSYIKSELHLKYSALFFQISKYIVLVFSIGGLAAFSTYITLGILWKEDFTVESYYAASPVALIASFWFFAVFFDFKKYERLLE